MFAGRRLRPTSAESSPTIAHLQDRIGTKGQLPKVQSDGALINIEEANSRRSSVASANLLRVRQGLALPGISHYADGQHGPSSQPRRTSLRDIACRFGRLSVLPVPRAQRTGQKAISAEQTSEISWAMAQTAAGRPRDRRWRKRRNNVEFRVSKVLTVPAMSPRSEYSASTSMSQSMNSSSDRP